MISAIVSYDLGMTGGALRAGRGDPQPSRHPRPPPPAARLPFRPRRRRWVLPVVRMPVGVEPRSHQLLIPTGARPRGCTDAVGGGDDRHAPGEAHALLLWPLATVCCSGARPGAIRTESTLCCCGARRRSVVVAPGDGLLLWRQATLTLFAMLLATKNLTGAHHAMAPTFMIRIMHRVAHVCASRHLYSESHIG